MALISCDECGKQISDRAAACPNCGAPIAGNLPRTSVTPLVVAAPKSRSAAILLAMLLGGLGIHKFYLNKPGMGVLYMLFCWTFIPAILGFIEGLNYLFMSEETFQKRYVFSAL
jgi:TM2 domain-containing membrane protein YozV